MKFRKKPVVIDAWVWDETNSTREMLAGLGMETSGWSGHVARPDECKGLRIKTLKGYMSVSYGDWIIRGVAREFYPCKPDIFKATYEEESVSEETGKDVELYGNMDARVWAKEFVRSQTDQVKAGGTGMMDEDVMIGWFSNSIMTGYDHGRGPINGDHAQHLLEKQESLTRKAALCERMAENLRCLKSVVPDLHLRYINELLSEYDSLPR